MKPIKLSRQQFEELRGYEPTKIVRTYEEYERRHEASLVAHEERSFTLAELDAKVRSRLLPEGEQQ